MNRPIPLVDLNSIPKKITKEIKKSINIIIKNNSFILGNEVKQFEENFAEYCGTKFAIGLGSGGSALELGMRACGIEKGDEVITPVNSFIASASAISFTGARPVFVDCDEKNFNIDPSKIEQKITKRTKAIMPVHLYGRPADMDQIKKIAKKYHLLIVEDACQAHGAIFNGQKVGSFGIFGAFSFYPSKNLGAWGDGGLITTNNKNLARRVKRMRDYGQNKKYYHECLGLNTRLDTIQAAVLLIKLKYLDKWNLQRLKIAQQYNKILKNLPLITPKISLNELSVFHLYVIRTKKRDQLANFLSQKGISTGLHYPIPIHLQKAYKNLGYKKGAFPVAEKLASEILSLPMYPQLKEAQIHYISGALHNFFNKYAAR